MFHVLVDGLSQATTPLNGADAVRGKKSYSGVSVVSVTPAAMADSSAVSTAAVIGRRKEEAVLPKTIDQLGSVALITNNISGPAMMGLPHLFHAAGIVPAVSCILVVWCCASLSGTMLADAIQRIPGNRNFSKNVNFSTAFRLIVGEDWYVIAETLFILSCMVQACAALVETAQSLDGFLASFVLGKTWALQIFPGPALLEWSPEDCKPATDFEVESGLEDCTPFNDAGSLVFTLGFATTTALFYPLGRGHLKETIVVQIISFAVLFVLLAQFYYEFWARGFHYAETVPWFGTDFSQLAGVVLFNYAFSITVPSWLNEKMPEVSVNRTIWTSTTLSSMIYISFGLLAAFAFENAGSNLLILLSSSQVHYMTRICAALYGTSIIGCGVPVFCVMIKTALRSGAVCSKPWAQFFGAAFPYCLSWMLYQGTVLMTVLNWTGLLVNGMVAFILPLVLALHASKRIKAGYSHVEPQDSKLIELTISGVFNDSTTSQEKEDIQNNFGDGGTAEGKEGEVIPLWPCIEPARGCLIVTIILLFSCTIAATLLVDTYLDEPTDRRR